MLQLVPLQVHTRMLGTGLGLYAGACRCAHVRIRAAPFMGVGNCRHPLATLQHCLCILPCLQQLVSIPLMLLRAAQR